MNLMRGVDDAALSIFVTHAILYVHQ